MYDAILILGGGVRERGELPPWVAVRFDLALELARGEPLVCLSAGTTHRPPPIEDGFPIAESVAGSRYLLRRGVPASRIRIENASYDTIGNAYFAKLIHVDPPEWRKLLIITSEFHMPRTQAVFDWIYGFEPGRYQIDYRATPDCGLAPEHLSLRREKEREALKAFERLRRQLGSLRTVHEWLFTEHEAYAAGSRRTLRRPQDARLLESY